MKQETKKKLKKAGEIGLAVASLLPAGKVLSVGLKARSAYTAAKAAKKAKQVKAYKKYKENSFSIPGQAKRVRINKTW